ncbi:MAG: BatD family protein [Bacteroidales bacterium]|nr:BatD family protein [Bacteroidales bacterium]
MKRYKIIGLFLVLLIGAMSAWADDVVFQANAPKQVVLGKPFQISYSVNQRAKNFRAPEFVDFDVLAGPYTSQSSSTSFVNGKRSSAINLTFTYTIMAQKEGTFSIAPATIMVSGEQYRSNGLKITVLPPDEEEHADASRSGSNSSNAKASSKSSNSGSAVSGENIFMKTIVSKTKVKEQECILLQYKIYWAGVDLAQFTNNTQIPEFKGFLKQDLEQGEIQTNLEHYNGRNYNTAVIYQTLLYPQRAGEVKIEPASFEAVLRVQNRANVRSLFEEFYGSYTNVTKTLNAPGTTIHVSSLPSGKPAGFSSGVGQFSIQSSISSQDITTNDAVTIRLTIQGTGNMKLVKTPAVDWPEGFEVYDPKVQNNFKSTTAGVSGTKSIEYLAIARAAGDYTIPPISFSYYDTQADEYRVLQTPEYTVHVARDAADQSQQTVVNTFVDKEDIRQLGTDIRYIHTTALPAVREPLLSGFTGLWWLLYLVPTLLAALLFVVFRKRIRENADESRVRYKKAGKVAQKRLKKAKKLMSESNAAFYEEIERAAWTYLSDRLSIPTAELNKDNIAEILRAKGTAEALIKQVREVLSTAEFARYAPSAAGSMQDLYSATESLINALEDAKL